MELKFEKIGMIKGESDATKKSIQNLLTHLPGEATGLYLIGLDVFGKEANAFILSIVAIVSLGIMILIRTLAKASTAVFVTSFIAFVLWVYAIGNGPFQALGIVLPQGVSAFAIAVFSTVVTVLANKGLIK